MEKLYSFSFFFLSLFASAQNYQAVYSNTESFYHNGNAQRIYGIKPDSFVVVNGDSVFYHYRTAVDTNTTASGIPSECSDLALDYPTWQGEKTIVSNDSSVYFNYFNDSIFIRSGTLTGQSWVLYKFSNGDLIRATHLTTAYEAVGTFTDSVKTFSLIAQDAIGNTVAHPVNGKQIKLSKYKGWFQSFNWRDFPTDTAIWAIEPAMRLTKRELNDLYPGDVVHYQAYYSQGPTPERFETYLTRQDYGSDSIVFNVARKINSPVPTGTFPPYTWNTSHDTIHKVVMNPDSLIFSKMPEQINNTGFIGDILGYYMQRFVSGTCTKYLYEPGFKDQYEYFQDSSCYVYTFEPMYDGTRYISGAGKGLYYYDYQTQMGPYYYESCALYSDSCGNHITVGINKAVNSDVSISVFPNPASSHIQIRVPEIFRNIPVNCVLRDYLGKAIQTEKIITGSVIEIPVLHLSSGIYLLELQSENIHLHSKFVKVNG